MWDGVGAGLSLRPLPLSLAVSDTRARYDGVGVQVPTAVEAEVLDVQAGPVLKFKAPAVAAVGDYLVTTATTGTSVGWRGLVTNIAADGSATCRVLSAGTITTPVITEKLAKTPSTIVAPPVAGWSATLSIEQIALGGQTFLRLVPPTVGVKPGDTLVLPVGTSRAKVCGKLPVMVMALQVAAPAFMLAVI